MAEFSKVEIRLGFLAPPISEQCPWLKADDAHQIQMNINALNRLRAHGILPGTAVKNAERKIMQMILRAGKRSFPPTAARPDAPQQGEGND